jgi:purine-binding chemotaxis protein CheW
MPQYCTFRVGDLLLGVEVLRVQEVIRDQVLTPVPLAHRSVSGLINLRGQIVTAIDLRVRLGLAAAAGDEPKLNVVVQQDGDAVALRVDEIGDVAEVGAESFEPTPETVRGTLRDLVVGVHKLEGRLLLVLDIDRVIDLSAKAAA